MDSSNRFWPLVFVIFAKLVVNHLFCGIDVFIGPATKFFDFAAGTLQGDTLALYLFIICVDCILQPSVDLMKEYDFTLQKARSRGYTAETITDVDYADDIVLHTNTLTQTESLLHRLEQAAGGIGFHVDVSKIEYMCFNQNPL